MALTPVVEGDSQRTPTPNTDRDTTSVVEQWIVVYRETDPEAWPWTVDSVTRRRDPGDEVVVELEDGRSFTIDAGRGSARWAASYELLREGKTPDDLSEVIELGLDLCL